MILLREDESPAEIIILAYGMEEGLRGFYEEMRRRFEEGALADLLMNAQKITDHAKRAELYRKAEQIIHDEVVRVFIANNQPPIPLQRRVRGYVPNPTAVEYFNTVSFGQ